MCVCSRGSGKKQLGSREVREAVSMGGGLRSWSSNIAPVPHYPRAFLLSPLRQSQDSSMNQKVYLIESNKDKNINELNKIKSVFLFHVKV